MRSPRGASAALRLLRLFDDREWIALDEWAAGRDGPRWGWGFGPSHEPLRRLLSAHEDEYAAVLDLIDGLGDELARIGSGSAGSPLEPDWGYPHFHGLDAASLYTFLRDRRPARYVEIGSGNSTRFAARAKRDGGLVTKLVSVDPVPRLEIDELCDEVVRAPLQRADRSLFEALQPGDILFLDGSHRVFPDNDVVVFFLELLPALAAGVLVGIHDIWLPDDYPPGQFQDRFSEQYMLAMAIAAGQSWVKPVFPCHFVQSVPRLSERVDEIWARTGIQSRIRGSSAFWFEVAAGRD
jgi:hypothetical protein